MFRSSVFLWLALFICGISGQRGCPDPESISPCTCSHDSASNEATVDCSPAATSEEIKSAFNDASWPSTQLTEFRLTGNEGVEELPEGAFGPVSFRNVYIYDSEIRTVHPSVLLSSKDRLEDVTIQWSQLEVFPFQILPELTRLLVIDLTGNSLTSVPGLQSFNLQELHLTNNNIVNVEGGWSTPNLKHLYFDQNPISDFPSGLLQEAQNLQEFGCAVCGLGPTIRPGFLEFYSNALRQIHLTTNSISILEPGAFTGLTADTEIGLQFNLITDLPEESFRPMLEVLSMGDGYISVGYNLIECGCSLAWLVRNPQFLSRVTDGTCVNGGFLQDLDPDDFQHCI